jgi:hypothetical protein
MQKMLNIRKIALTADAEELYPSAMPRDAPGGVVCCRAFTPAHCPKQTMPAAIQVRNLLEGASQPATGNNNLVQKEAQSLEGERRT